MKMRIFIITLTFSMLSIFSMSAHASYRDAFQREFIDKPWAGAPIVEEGVCIECHISSKMNPDYLKIPQEWKMSIHYKNRVSCHDCHGGDPSDAAVSCGTPHSGFVGTPKYKDVPNMCGKCHLGILERYQTSGHGRALKASGAGPNCVTCHGSHRIQKANIDIINEVRCTKCHTYQRAKAMKQALFLTEKKIGEIESTIDDLKTQGVDVSGPEKALFRTSASFRTVFHSVNVDLVKEKSSSTMSELSKIESDIVALIKELGFRRNFSAFLFILFVAFGVVYYMYSKE